MLCRAIPYEGNEPYIFLSYCHQNAAVVYPMLEQMVRDGYRVWYDDGNHPGDDWLDNIARHLENGAVVLAMISEASSNSHNCKSELSYTIEIGKTPVAVVLEEFAMPRGMRMQLSSIHYIKKHEYPSEYSLLQKLYETEALAACRTTPGSIPMRNIEQSVPVATQTEVKQTSFAESYVEAEKQIKVEEPAAVVETTPKAVAEPAKVETTKDAVKVQAVKKKVKPTVKKKSEQSITVPETDCVQPEPAVASPVSEEVPSCAEPIVSVEYEIGSSEPSHNENEVCDADSDDNDVTVYEDSHDDVLADGAYEETPTEYGNQQQAMVLVRVNTGKAYVLQTALSRIGRSEQRCDVVLSDNSSISNCHAEIIQYHDQCYLRDADSTNGTFVNGQQLGSGDKVRLTSGMIFHLDKEVFLFLDGAQADRLIKLGSTLFLRNVNTDGVRVLLEESLWLDRGHKWEDGTLNDGKISRKFKHAVIQLVEGVFMLSDKGSTNGTFLNGSDLRGQPPAQIKEMDRIRLGDTVLEVRTVAF